MSPPRALLQISLDEGIAVDMPWLPSIERDPMAFDRPTAPAPFWVESIAVDEPEPRQTTPSMVRLEGEPIFAHRRWVSALFAAVLVFGGVSLARVFAADAVVAE